MQKFFLINNKLNSDKLPERWIHRAEIHKTLKNNVKYNHKYRGNENNNEKLFYVMQMNLK